MISRVASYDYLGSLAFYPAGLALAGPLADAVGVTTVLWGSAVVAVLVSCSSSPGATSAPPRRWGRSRREAAAATAAWIPDDARLTAGGVAATLHTLNADLACVV